jgi:hypothetical protein
MGFYKYTSLALKDNDYRREFCSRTNNVILYVITIATVAYLKILYYHSPGRTRKSINNLSLARNLNELPPKYKYIVMTIGPPSSVGTQWTPPPQLWTILSAGNHICACAHLQRYVKRVRH